MDDRLEKALEHANYSVTLAITKKNLSVRYQNDLLFSINGGTFTVTPELITFVDLLVRAENPDGVIVDDKGTPIRIDDLSGFLEAIMGAYKSATNTYHAGFEKIRKARSVKALAGIK